MKYLDKLIPVALGLALLTSCADNDVLGFSVSQPDSLANLNYLKKYDVLKSYVDRTANPNFKLGVGVSASSFENKDALYQIAATNFDEVTAGYAMKHGAVVQTDGSIDTATVKEFLQNVRDAGLSTYGHTLCWHSNQNATYLNKLLEPNVIIAGEDDVKNAYCFKVTNSAVKNPWEAQAIFNLPDEPAVTPGKKYELEIMVKGTVEGSMTPATFTDWKGSDFAPVDITTSWHKVTTTNVMTAGITNLKSILFNMGAYLGTIYIDDFKLYELDDNGNRGKNLNVTNSNFNDAAATAASWTTFSWSSSSFTEYGASAAGEGYVAGVTYVEKTDEEKATIIDSELDRWIRAMVEASKDYVHAWDVVNEPMDDSNTSALKSGKSKTELADDEFYWQDYLGKDYAVKAFNYAHKYANSTDKMFINDYGLEATDGKKLTGLLDYITYVESQGATIDGIGTQMHVSVNTADRDAITNMFKKLAATGKLVKISELDMGIGDGIVTAAVTDAQLKEQSDLYQFIIQAYFDNVPAAQRYGITQWSPVDASASSLWRANEPVGLWTQSYDRKRAYAGFANGLAGKEVFTNE